MGEIDKIFENLNDWMKLPKYQLERRVDIFFSIYLDKILEEKLGIKREQIKEILPEFSLRKKVKEGKETYASNNADYAVLVEKNEKIKMYLVELKTEMNSISEAQKEYYEIANTKKLREILQDIIEIEKNSKQWRKYDYLLEKLEKINLIKLDKDNGGNYRKSWSLNKSIKIDDKVDIIYITPIEPEKDEKLGCKYKSIIFNEICEILKDEKGEFTKKFTNLLENIEQYNEKERNIRKKQ